MQQYARILTILLVLTLFVSYRISGSRPDSRTAQELGNEGYRELWSGDTAGAVEVFRKALLADAAFPYRWTDLGDALDEQGTSQEAAYCFARAVALAPASPQVAMRAANFYIRKGDYRKALGLQAGVLAETAEFDEVVFTMYTRFGGDFQDVLSVGIAANHRAAQSFFSFLLARELADWIEPVARWLDRHGDLTPELGRREAAWMLNHSRPARAAALWPRWSVSGPEIYRVTNWVDDGGFEESLSGAGFDWKEIPVSGVKIDRDENIRHSGRAALRLEFDGSGNVAFENVSQASWLEPGNYELSAWVRAGSLSTDRGVGLRAAGATTEVLTGTAEWTRLSTHFEIRGKAQLVNVQIVRLPSSRFDNRIRGTAWVDDVVLRRVS